MPGRRSSNKRSEIREQNCGLRIEEGMGHREKQLAADSRQRAGSSRQRTEVRGKQKEERDSPVRAAFSRDLAISTT
jgi:hypothetical protein